MQKRTILRDKNVIVRTRQVFLTGILFFNMGKSGFIFSQV